MERHRNYAPALVALLIPLAMVAAYVTAYFALGDVGTISDQGGQIGIIRIYDYDVPGVATLFQPAATLEARLTGQRVRVVRSIGE